MNKDLITIDDALNSGTLNENEDFEFDSATVEIIFGAAESMAEEIKRLNHKRMCELEEMAIMKDQIISLKAELEKYNISAFLETEYAMISKMSDADKMDLISRLLRVNEDKTQQIADMRGCLHDYEEKMNELEKRPEVVRCVECIYRDSCLKKLFLSKNRNFWFDLKWCSHGQRRESEVIK